MEEMLEIQSKELNYFLEKDIKEETPLQEFLDLVADKEKLEIEN